MQNIPAEPDYFHTGYIGECIILCVCVCPMQFKKLFHNTLTKVIADLEVKKKQAEEREHNERKRQREMEEEIEAKAKREKEWKKEWEVSEAINLSW